MISGRMVDIITTPFRAALAQTGDAKGATVADQPVLAGGEQVVTMPRQIDISNARAVGEELLAAFDAGIKLVIADLTGTSLCTAAGVHELALACERATASSVELRLAIPPGEALRVFILTGHDRWLPVYPSVQAASDIQPRRPQ